MFQWVKAWAETTPGMSKGELTHANMTEYILLEHDTMSNLQVELYSKLWCAWYDMRKAWRDKKVVTRAKMRAYWHSKWRKRVARAMEVDMRTNSTKARKKWSGLITEDGSTPKGWKLTLRDNFF